MTRRARKRAERLAEEQRIQEIEEYFEATLTCPDREFKLYGEFNTYIANPKNVAVVRSALKGELDAYYERRNSGHE